MTTPGFSMQQLALLLLLLCALLAPSSLRRGGAADAPASAAFVQAAPISNAAVPHSTHDGILAFGRPHSLVLPTCQRPHVIAHRGACGYLPEHTLQAYRLAIDLGVEYIEPDLVLTKDGHLICRHDVDLSETTDVADRPEFRDRRRNVTLASAVEVDAGGRPKQVQVQGFFSFDFTLAEIKSLRAKQRLTQRSATYNGLFQVPTFEEVVDMVREAEAATGRRVGIYAELKEPHFHRLQGFDIEGTTVAALHAKGLLAETLLPPPGTDVPAPLVIQCFDPETLRSLARRVPSVPLVQLLLSPTAKEHPSVGEGVSKHLGREAHYGDLSLDEIAAYASGIGPAKTVFTQLGAEEARALVDRAHALDLAVHPWTFRREAMFVDRAFASDSDEELRYFYECLNVDALFVEMPDQATNVINKMLADDREDADSEGPSGQVQQPQQAAGGRALGKNGTTAAARRLARQQQQKQEGAAAPAATVKENLTAATGSAATGEALQAVEIVSSSGSGTDSSSASTALAAFGLGERETCLQMRKARACSIDGPGSAFRSPSYVVPWMRRKAF